ncbi:hypothetical protein Tco_1501917, partial [Tanacetum coccineum]
YDLVIDASTISGLEAFFTGSVCLKSPPSIMLRPPNRTFGLFKISLRQRSKAKAAAIIHLVSLMESGSANEQFYLQVTTMMQYLRMQ